MNLRRILAVTKRVFRDIKNDKRTIGLMLIAPIFAMFVFGLAFSGNVEDIHVIVVNHDQGFQTPNGENISFSDKILSNLNNETLDIEYMDDEDKAIRKIEDGNAYAVIIFPENFTKNAYLGVEKFSPSFMRNSTVDSPFQAQIMIKDDESITTIKNSIIGAVQEAITETMKDEGIKFPVKVTQDAVYAKDADFIDSFVPGIMAFVVFLLATLLTLLAFVGERISGTLDRLMATPLQESEIVLGYALAFGTIGMIQAAFLLTVAVLVFNIMILGNVFLAFFVVALLAVVSQALGILLSSLAKREGQVIQFIPFIILPAFLLSGVFWPIEAIPRWLRPFSYMVPPTYAVDACRAIMLKGWGVSKIWPNIIALVIFAIFFLMVAVWSLKKGKD
ncbi:MAG TPA: ABC transporter permease [Methanothermobacter sp.]|nr:ABC transporter [Methanothermobacter sp. MT-2]HHW05643.1 ABC transporter permease [Methanothermobacter sp.]HOK72743.1 ABC transporter permease [Methanothermobacter sp.]HOL68537.1 ABC transporter permease [Methanothermobacter sp.]HPQ04296.1 ABC transporter permease [Methanothermobacter sp.]